jgi:ribosomal protein S12 methylthiotransferase
MPIQHADDAILRAMRRGVTARRMREIVAAFRAAIPGVTVRTTVLLGFPGETEASLERLLEFIEDVRFDRLGTFTYSPEEGTPSPEYPGQVPDEVAAERAARVQECQDRIAWELGATLLGAEVDVLVDGPAEDPAFAFEGRMAGQAPEIDGVVYLRDAAAGRRRGRSFTPGQFARVRIVEAEGHELIGERA